MSTDYELKRSISDIQSRISLLDHRVLRMTAGAPASSHPGRAFFSMALASLHRLRGDEVGAEKALQRAATSPAQVGVATWAAELASSPVGGFLIAIRKQSAYAALVSRTQAFSIEHEQMPKIVAGGEIAAGFIGEGAPIAVAKGALTPLSLTPKKLAALVTVSEELLNYGVNVNATLRQLMGLRIASALDAAFFSSAAVSAAAPAGVLAGVSATTASAATPPIDAARADLRALVAALSAPTDVVFITAPARALYLATILPDSFNFPVLASAALPAARVIAVDAGPGCRSPAAILAFRLRGTAHCMKMTPPRCRCRRPVRPTRWRRR